MTEETAGQDAGEGSLIFSLLAGDSRLQAGAGREILFTRAILTMRNVCNAELGNVVPHATLGQEGGTVQDISRFLTPSVSASLPAGEIISWDVYDLLLSAHPGTASKIHMFGYRAVLNWQFDLAAWAEYCSPASSAPARTPVSRWTLRWSVSDTSTGEVVLVIEDVNN